MAKMGGKGQSEVGTKFPNFPEARGLPAKGKAPSVGKIPNAGVRGGKSALGGKKV